MMRIPRPPRTGFKSRLPEYKRRPGLLTRLIVWITRSPLGPYFNSIRSNPEGSASTSFQSQIKPSRFSTSATPRFTRLVGMSTKRRSTRTALRIRVNISAIGSVIMVSVPYQLLFRTPGIKPLSAIWRKQIRQRPNLRYTDRGRPQMLQRFSRRVENFGSRFALATFDLLATGRLPIGFDSMDWLRRKSKTYCGLGPHRPETN